MKFTILLLLMATVSFAQPKAIQERAVSFATSVTQYDARITPWATYYGSYQKNFEHQRVLNIKIRVVGEVYTDFAVVWCFIAQSRDGSGLKVFGSGDAVGKLDRGNSAQFLIDSPLISGTDAKYVALQIRSQSGLKPFGWGLAMVQEGRIVAATGSTPECRQIGIAHAQEAIAKRGN